MFSLPPPAAHTPYDGSSKPFTISTRPLEVKDWIEVDQNLAAYLAEKRRLYQTCPQQVLVAETGTGTAQQEVLELLEAHLLKYHSDLYVRHPREGGGPAFLATAPFKLKLDPRLRGDDGYEVMFESDLTSSPLARAALLVQEDLILMRASPQGWRLVAASLCFPSAWNLLEKFGKPLHEVHGPVPGFGTATRNATMIDRMFDNLQPEQPLLRWNWSLHEDDKLHHPTSHSGIESRFGTGDIGGHVFLRVERQTLRKLPISGDILFTVRIYLDPLEVLETLPEGGKLAQAIDQQLTQFSPEQESYKGIVGERQRLSARFKQIAAKNPG
ncbi:MAG: DUF3445 domain-containing protein [Alphaproteobacteria bacterium]|nr:DUF3445 domain-containing protein [Alphaproteobacteria bacterium]